MVTGIWYTYDPNFGSILIWRCKEHPCPLSSHSGLWRLLEVPELGLASWSCLDMFTGLWYTHDPNFGSLYRFWGCKEHPCPLSPHLGLWRMMKVPYWGLAFLTWLGYGQEPCLDLSWSFDLAQIKSVLNLYSLEIEWLDYWLSWRACETRNRLS